MQRHTTSEAAAAAAAAAAADTLLGTYANPQRPGQGAGTLLEEAVVTGAIVTTTTYCLLLPLTCRYSKKP